MIIVYENGMYRSGRDVISVMMLDQRFWIRVVGDGGMLRDSDDNWGDYICHDEVVYVRDGESICYEELCILP